MTATRAASKIDQTIAKLVRRRRTEMAMTQADLGAVIGCSYQQVQKYESGANRIAAGTLVLIADALKLDLAAFFALCRR